MKTFAFDFYNKQPQRILAFNSRKEAISHGNGWSFVSTEEELTDTNVTMGQMVELYNALTPESPIKNFRDRPTAIRRMIALAQAKAKIIESSEPQNESTMERKLSDTKENKPKKEKKPKKPKKEKAIAKEGGKKGRASFFEGKTVKVSSETTENPRREGSHGYRSMQILLDNRDGISYEEFISKGGRRQDLAWDVAHGYAHVE